MLLSLMVLSFFIIPIVRTGFGSNPKTGMDSGITSPNNKFVEGGRKSYSKSRENISVVSV